MAGLADSKYTAKDCSVMIGLTSPYSYSIPNYFNYDITKLKDNFRLLTIVLNREGTSNDSIGLYFDGMCNYFKELPKPNNFDAMNKVYKYIENKDSTVHKILLLYHEDKITIKKVNSLLHRLFKLSIFARTNKNNK